MQKRTEPGLCNSQGENRLIVKMPSLRKEKSSVPAAMKKRSEVVPYKASHNSETGRHKDPRQTFSGPFVTKRSHCLFGAQFPCFYNKGAKLDDSVSCLPSLKLV